MIGIIGAMEEEVKALMEMLSERIDKKYGSIKFSSGKYAGKDVVVCSCGIGKVFAAMAAQTMIIEYSPGLIINSGVAGALVPELKIGDIAVASGVVQHDMDTTATGQPMGLIPGIDIINIPCYKPASDTISECVKEFSIGCLSGIIASGDNFVGTIEDKSRIAKDFGAVACEMEGAAIGQVCYSNGVDFSVIRAVSDSLSDNSGMEFEEFLNLAADNSIKVMKRFLEKY